MLATNVQVAAYITSRPYTPEASGGSVSRKGSGKPPPAAAPSPEASIRKQRAELFPTLAGQDTVAKPAPLPSKSAMTPSTAPASSKYTKREDPVPSVLTGSRHHQPALACCFNFVLLIMMIATGKTLHVSIGSPNLPVSDCVTTRSNPSWQESALSCCSAQDAPALPGLLHLKPCDTDHAPWQ